MKQFKPFDYALIRTKEGWVRRMYCFKDNLGYYATADCLLLSAEDDIIPYKGNEHLLGTNNEPEEEIILKYEERIVGAKDVYTLLQGRGTIDKYIATHENYINAIASNYACCIPFSQFKEKNTKHDILCVRNGKLVRYE